MYSKLGILLSSMPVNIIWHQNITKYDESYTQKLEIKCGNTVIKTINGIENNDEIVLIGSEINALCNLSTTATSFLCDYVLTTYDGINVVGTDTKQTNYHLLQDTNTVPAFSNFDYVDTNAVTVALTGNNKKLILGYSNVLYTISTSQKAVAYRNSPVTLYYFADGGTEEYSSVSAVTHTTNKINSNTLCVQAENARGFRSKLVSKLAVSVNDYYKPTIFDGYCIRTDGAGESVELNVLANAWVGNFGAGNNVITNFSYRVKEKTSSTWSNWFDATTAFNTALGSTPINQIDVTIPIYSDGTSAGFTTGVEHDVQIKISDGISTSVVFNESSWYSLVLDDGKVLDSYYKSNTGYKYAINDIVDTTLDDGLQVGGKLYVNKKEVLTETLIYEGILNSNETITISNISQYKRLKCLACVYALKNNIPLNSGGSGNILELDLSIPDENICRSGIVIPYYTGDTKDANAFYAIVQANVSTNEITCWLGYGNNVNVEDIYSIRKIWGVK